MFTARSGHHPGRLYPPVPSGPQNRVYRLFRDLHPPTGLDYVDVENGRAYWVIEDDGWWNSDIPGGRISLGRATDGEVALPEYMGGGKISLDVLEEGADRFWNEYGDISELPAEQQLAAIRAVVSRLAAGTKLERGYIAGVSGAAGGSVAMQWESMGGALFNVAGGNRLLGVEYDPMEAYEQSALGQTADSSGFFYYGTRGAIGVAVAATTAAVAVGTVEFAFLGNQPIAEINILSKRHVFKIISRPFQRGFRINPAHHGKPWGHPHVWHW